MSEPSVSSVPSVVHSHRALTSASNIFRRDLCPGSAEAESICRETLPDEDSEYSAEGTLLHDLDANPDKDRSALTSEQRDVLGIAARGDEEIFSLVEKTYRNAGAAYEEGHEIELWLYDGLRKVMPGHADRWRYYPGARVLVIIDKKFGRRVVTTAEWNLQLRAYAVMAWKKWPDVETIIVAINQPRLPFNERLSISDYTRETLPVAKAHILRIHGETHERDGTPRSGLPRVAGEAQCRYCAARVHCDAYRAQFQTVAAESGRSVAAYTERLRLLTDDELATVYFHAIKFAESVKDDTEAEIRRRLDRGDMPMVETKPGRKITKITDPARARLSLKSDLALTDAEIDARSAISLSKVADYIQTRDKITGKAAKDRVTAAVADLIEETNAKPSLALVNAKLTDR